MRSVEKKNLRREQGVKNFVHPSVMLQKGISLGQIVANNNRGYKCLSIIMKVQRDKVCHLCKSVEAKFETEVE